MIMVDCHHSWVYTFLKKKFEVTIAAKEAAKALWIA